MGNGLPGPGGPITAAGSGPRGPKPGPGVGKGAFYLFFKIQVTNAHVLKRQVALCGTQRTSSSSHCLLSKQSIVGYLTFSYFPSPSALVSSHPLPLIFLLESLVSPHLPLASRGGDFINSII